MTLFRLLLAAAIGLPAQVCRGLYWLGVLLQALILWGPDGTVDAPLWSTWLVDRVARRRRPQSPWRVLAGALYIPYASAVKGGRLLVTGRWESPRVRWLWRRIVCADFAAEDAAYEARQAEARRQIEELREEGFLP